MVKVKKISSSYYKTLLEHRKLLSDRNHDSSATFDRTLVTLASGAIALTIVILTDIAPEPVENSLWLIFSSWISFALSLSFILASHRIAIHGRRRLIVQMDSFIKRNRQVNIVWNISKWAGRLSWASFAFLSIGVAFFLAFVYANLLPGG